MVKSKWRQRREAYLRECGRSNDLIREGYETEPRSQWMVIEGGRQRPGRTGGLSVKRWPEVSPMPFGECIHAPIRYQSETAVSALSVNVVAGDRRRE